MRNKTMLFSVLVLLLFAVLTVSADNRVYLDPSEISIPDCSDTTVLLKLNSSDAVGGFQADIKFDPAVAKITNIAFVEDYNTFSIAANYTSYYRLVGVNTKGDTAGEQNLATLTIECVGCDGSEILVEFTDEYGSVLKIANKTGGSFPATWTGSSIVCGTPPSTTAGVVINEFVSDGTEWIELYNAGTEPVNLVGWTLQDTVVSHVITLSETIPADGYVVLDCSWLNNGGDIIYLNDTDGNTIDMVAYGDHGDAPNPSAGESAGRDPDGTGDFRIFDTPTPGASNVLPTAGTLASCDSSGVEKDQFAPGETVYVEGSGLEASTIYTIWIQNESVEDGDALNKGEDPSGSQEAVKTDASGNLPRTAIWAIPQDEDVTHTEYDIVVDDEDGTYNAASDYIDSATTAGIVAPIPELPTFILTCTGIGILGLVLLARRRE